MTAEHVVFFVLCFFVVLLICLFFCRYIVMKMTEAIIDDHMSQHHRNENSPKRIALRVVREHERNVHGLKNASDNVCPNCYWDMPPGVGRCSACGVVVESVKRIG
jgi:hypothetical protein